MRRTLVALAVPLMAAGLFTASADAEQAPKGGDCTTSGEYLHFNNAANNANGFGDTLSEVRDIAGVQGYPPGPGDTWQEGGRTHKNWFFPPCNAPHGNTVIEFAEYTNSWKLESKYEYAWFLSGDQYPYPDN